MWECVVYLPANEKSLFYHVGILISILASSHSHICSVDAFIPKRIPRYVMILVTGLGWVKLYSVLSDLI